MTTAIIAGAAELSPKDAALAKIGAAIARGEQDKLTAAFTEAFDAGLTLDQATSSARGKGRYCLACVKVKIQCRAPAAASVMAVQAETLDKS